MKRKYVVEYWQWRAAFGARPSLCLVSSQHYRALRCAKRAADRSARRHLDGRYVGWERYQAVVCVSDGQKVLYEPGVERAMSVGERSVW
jgi:hypothetical protein